MSGSVVLRAVGVTGHGMPPLPVWIQSGDVDAHDGLGAAEYTTDRSKAKVFPDGAAALLWWRQQSKVRPLRDDGKPNRPLTAITIATEPAFPSVP